MPITPAAMEQYAYVIIALSLISVIYIGLVALSQTDIKRLIAYSSVAHMGFVTLGCALVYPISLQHGHNAEMIHTALEGGMMQLIALALVQAPCSSPLVLSINNCMKERLNNTAVWPMWHQNLPLAL